MKDNLFRKYNTPLKGGVLLPHLIKIKGRQCECCKNTIWLDQPINLQVHHIDGDKTNNELSNLQLLCLNCHSYTDNFGSKNKKHKNEISDEEFIKALEESSSIRQALFSLGLSDGSGNYTRANALISKNNIKMVKKKPETNKSIKYCICGKQILPSSKYCKECSSLYSRVVERPTREELKRLIRISSFTKIGNQFGVTDNAIRKWCDAYKLPRTVKEIKTYSDEEWNNL